MYLLDTNVCIRILNNSSKQLVSKLKKENPTQIRLCSVVKAELCFGARKSSKVEENLAVLKKFFAPFICLPFDDRCAQYYGIVRAELSSAGMIIGPNDMLIAAIALAHDLTLVSHNVKEFSRIIGLRLEDWE